MEVGLKSRHLISLLYCLILFVCISFPARAGFHATRGSIIMFEDRRTVYTYSAITDRWTSVNLSGDVVRYGLSEHLGLVQSPSWIYLYKPTTSRWISSNFVGDPIGSSVESGTALFWTDEACYGISTIWTLWAEVEMEMDEIIIGGGSAGNFALIWTTDRALAYSSSGGCWINQELKAPAIAGLTCNGLGMVWTPDSSFAFSPIDREWVSVGLAGSGDLRASGGGNVGLIWNQNSACAYSVQQKSWSRIWSLPSFVGGVAHEDVALVWTADKFYFFNAHLGQWQNFDLDDRVASASESPGNTASLFEGFRISPNPCTSGSVQFDLPAAGSPWRVIVVDITGRQVLYREYFNSNAGSTVNLELTDEFGLQLSGGRYWLHLQNDNRSEVRPLILIK